MAVLREDETPDVPPAWHIPVPPLQLGAQLPQREQRSHSTPSAPGRVASRTNSRGYPNADQARIDALVNEHLTECLTDRANFRSRAERVHNNGELTWEERFQVAARAIWAVPLVLLGKGVQAAGVSGCSRIVRSPPTVVHEDGDDVAPNTIPPFTPTVTRAQEPGTVWDGLKEQVSASKSHYNEDFDSQSPQQQPQRKLELSEREVAQSSSGPALAPGGKGGPKGRGASDDRSAVSVSAGMTSSAASVLGPMAKAKGASRVNRKKNQDDGASVLSTQQNPQSAAAAALGPMMQPGGRPRPKPRNEGASVLDLQQNPQSSAASVLGAIAQPGGGQQTRPARRREGSAPAGGASVLDVAQNPQSSAASVLGGLSKPGSNQRLRQPAGPGSTQSQRGTYPAGAASSSVVSGSSPSGSAGARGGSPGPYASAEGEPQRQRAPRPKADAGRSVISSSSAFNSGSAAASLLGPMVTGKGKGRSKGTDRPANPQSIPE